MKKQLIGHIAQRLRSYGYTVYIAKTGEYGFYTDGVKVVSFGGHWQWSVDFSGNYKTNAPHQTGTGWRIAGELSDISEDQARAFINATAPDWATRGASIVKYETPAQHLQTYGSSSAYVEFDKADAPLIRYHAEFHGRKLGAIGITYSMTEYVTAKDEAGALIELYKKHEHIRYAKFTPAPRKFTNTATALAVYDGSAAARCAAWDKVVCNDDVNTCVAADAAALALVQDAFYTDTADINGRDNCALVDIEFMRRMVAGGAK